MEETSNLIINIFNTLKKNNINYCVLRNYESLPEHVGHDIDILLNEKDLEIFNESINTVAESNRWEVVYTRNKYMFYTIMFYKIDLSSVNTLKLDVWTELSWRGAPYIDSEFVLDNTVEYKNFYIPRSGCEAAITSLKELTGGGNIPKKYYEKIKKLALVDKQGFLKSTVPIFGQYANKLYSAVTIGNWSMIDDNKVLIKNKIFSSNNKLRNVERTISFWKSEIVRRAKNSIHPKGSLIVFVGPDGSGKSTVINLVSSSLSEFYPKIYKFHMRFNLFPEIKTGLGLTTVRKNNNSLPNSKKEKNTKERKSNVTLLRFLASWVVVLYYTIEFWLSNYTVWLTKRRSGLILFDRYYYDFFVQPSYRDIIWRFRSILLFFVPKPDAVIYLKASPETVYKRKGELNIKEIETQDNYFSKILSSVKDSYIIDTEENNLDRINAEVCQIIINKFKQ